MAELTRKCVVMAVATEGHFDLWGSLRFLAELFARARRAVVFTGAAAMLAMLEGVRA